MSSNTDYKIIRKCRLCNSSNLRLTFTLGKTPLANSYLGINDKRKLKEYPLSLLLCKNCGHLQLSHCVYGGKKFKKYLYRSNTSKQNLIHFKNYAEKLIKISNNKNNKILDIAANDGTFLNFLKKKNFFLLGIDPAKNLQKYTLKKKIKQIVGFFNFKKSNELKKKYGFFTIVTANHVCAHVDDLQDFFKGIKNILDKNGIFVFEVSYRLSVIKNLLFDTIYHEHIDYHAIKPIKIFLKKFNLEIFDVNINNAQGGSVRYYICNKNKRKINSKKISNLIKREELYGLYKLKTYNNFFTKIKNAKKKLRKIIDDIKCKNLNIAGYGAAAKTTTFTHFFNIDDGDLNFIVDDNKLKQSKKIPGKKLKILDPIKIYKKNINYILILAWNYSKHIIDKHKILLKKNKKFIIPFPKIKIITQHD